MRDVEVAACTVATRGQLPAARVLAASYLRHHPGHTFEIAVTDDGSQDFGIENYQWFAMARTADELARAVAPHLVRRLLDEHRTVLLLPPQSLVRQPFPEFDKAFLDFWAEVPPGLVRFTEYDPNTPWLYDGKTLLSENPELRQLCDEYRNLLLANGHRDVPYGFASLVDGTPITPPMRELFKEHPEPPSDIQAWLREDNRLVNAVWRSRPDLQQAFPNPRGKGFHDWCHEWGVRENAVPTWALPEEPETPQPPTPDFGVNVAGFHTAELGIGEMGRIVLKALEKAGIPHVSVVEEDSIRNTVRTALDKPKNVGRPRFPVSLITVNGDSTRALLDTHPEVGDNRYRIGLWAWELEDFPAGMHSGFGLVDEVWTVSDFTTRAIAKHSPIPVRTFPVPVPDPGESQGTPGRFLFAFDHNSTAGRKNPYGVVEAFQKAFPGRDDVHLTIKSTNADKHVSAAERLRLQTLDDPRITLIERYLTPAELHDLYKDSHAYVSLHRSEGFGLTVAEAMIRGMAVISTDYSSTPEFLDETTGWPIPYTMTSVGEGWPPYPPDGQWADPDLDAAAKAMREIADNPDEARARGANARQHLLRTRSVEKAGEWLQEQLTAAHEKWQARQPMSVARRAARKVRNIVGGKR